MKVHSFHFFLIALTAIAQTSSQTASASAAEFLDRVKLETASYLKSYEDPDGIKTAIQTQRIQKLFFPTINRPPHSDYRAGLQYLDQQAALTPFSEPILVLARTLQLKWEKEFAMGLSEKRVAISQSGEGIGALAGNLALLIAKFKNPSAIRTYFQAWRNQNAPRATRALLGLTGATVGGAYVGGTVADLILNSGGWKESIPPAPAEVMRLGVEQDFLQLPDEKLMDALLKSSVSAVGSAAVYDAIQSARWLSALNRAGTPLKISPVGLAVSILAGLFLEDLMVEAGRVNSVGETMMEIWDAVDAIEEAKRSGNHTLVYRQSQILSKLAMNFSALLLFDSHQAIMDFQEEIQEAQSSYEAVMRQIQKDACYFREPENLAAPAVGRLRSRVKSAYQELLSELEEDTLDPYGHSVGRDGFSHDFQIYSAIRFLRLFEGTEPISEIAQTLPADLRGIGRRLYREAQKDPSVPFQGFLSQMELAKDIEMRKLLINHKVIFNHQAILLQVSAYFRTLQVDYLDTLSEELDTLADEHSQIRSSLQAPDTDPIELILTAIRANPELWKPASHQKGAP